ncbi:adenosine receptor A2a-like [Actinia tenebrosa]|uniref:Adenosine receptor A2a-like n=1 Tax=Actinia tenebrosa TaxID=6105 RepID=A0A6P8IY54_ACTTE|nr:adenosine receptor A2a-like [Actinia tenebrosa]
MFSDIKLGMDRCLLGKEETIAMNFINILITILGSVGNIVVCLTIALTPSLQNLSSYCIFNLSVADLLATMIVEPCLIVILFWKLHGICLVKVEYVARLVGNLSCSISVLTLAIMSVERCLAIVKPMTYKRYITTTRLKTLLINSWLFCFITPCLDAFVDEDKKKTYVLFSMISMAILFVIILVSYAFLFRAVRKQSYARQQLRNTTSVSHEAEKRLARTVALVIGLFTIFWSPIIVRMAFKPDKNYGSDYVWTVIASLANSAVNPFVYFFRSKTFRISVRNIFQWGRCCKNNRVAQVTSGKADSKV